MISDTKYDLLYHKWETISKEEYEKIIKYFPYDDCPYTCDHKYLHRLCSSKESKCGKINMIKTHTTDNIKYILANNYKFQTIDYVITKMDDYFYLNIETSEDTHWSMSIYGIDINKSCFKLDQIDMFINFLDQNIKIFSDRTFLYYKNK